MGLARCIIQPGAGLDSSGKVFDVQVDGTTITINGSNQLVSSGGGGGPSLPTPAQEGDVLFAVDDGTLDFESRTPLTSTEGWLVSDSGVMLVVG